MNSVNFLRITLSRRHCKQCKDRVVEHNREQRVVNINRSIANGKEIFANQVTHEATF